MTEQAVNPEQAYVEEFVNEDGQVEQRVIPPGHPDHPASRRILTIADIVEVEDVLEATLFIPEWGGSVVVRGFSKAEQLAIRKEATIGGNLDRDRMELLLVIHGLKDPKLTEEHVGLLRGKSAAVIDRILNKVLALNGTSEEAVIAEQQRFPDGR